jgi:hypothetical protein
VLLEHTGIGKPRNKDRGDVWQDLANFFWKEIFFENISSGRFSGKDRHECPRLQVVIIWVILNFYMQNWKIRHG